MFKLEEEQGVSIISIEKDRLDSIVAPELKTQLLLLVDQGTTNILIDLSNVGYADSSGLGALLFGLRQIKNLGGQLKLCGANKKIMSLIKIARLDSVLLNFENRSGALDSFN